MGFLQKLTILYLFGEGGGGGRGVEGNIDQENVFCDILKRKNPFVGYKNKQFKKFKIWDLSMVLVKIGHFSTLSFFNQFRQGKWVLRSSETKKRFSRL